MFAKSKRLLALAAVSAFVLSVPSSAHHSTAMFKWGEEVTLKNVVVDRWEWTNPHTFLYVRVKGGDGKVRRWAFEGMSPNHLVRYGWSRRTVKPGDKIDLTYYALRDKRRGGFSVEIKKADGTILNQFSK